MMNLGKAIFDAIFWLCGALPQVPDSVRLAVDDVFNIMFDGVNLLDIFVDLDFVIVLIPIAIAILNFDKVIKLVMFILKKIPLLNIK